METKEMKMDKVHSAIQRTRENEFLTDEDFETLFEYYSHNGEMPYGTQKARTGDPYEWIIDEVLKGVK
jgi:hypothetical protein